MLLDGYSVTEKNMIEFAHADDIYVDIQDQIQPNGIDLRVKQIYRVHGKVHVPRQGKVEADLNISELPMKEGVWTLENRSQEMYFVDFFETLSLKDGYYADLKTRSSVVRAGIDVVCGLYDTGWTGTIGCCLRVYNTVTLEYGAKLCQLLVSESKFRGARYTGRYQGKNSQAAIMET